MVLKILSVLGIEPGSDRPTHRSGNTLKVKISFPFPNIIMLMISTEPEQDKTNKMTYVPSENSDQSGHLPSLFVLYG